MIFFSGFGLGEGQSWQVLTASRIANAAYTNSTGKPINVMVEFVVTAAVALSTVALGIGIVGSLSDGIGGIDSLTKSYALNEKFVLSIIVSPLLNVYSLRTLPVGISISRWWELR